MRTNFSIQNREDIKSKRSQSSNKVILYKYLKESKDSVLTQPTNGTISIKIQKHKLKCSNRDKE